MSSCTQRPSPAERFGKGSEMAGYGASIWAPAWCGDLIRRLLRASQQRAKILDLDMHFRHRKGDRFSEWEIWVDGDGYVIAGWSRQLERDLPVVAEGFLGPVSGQRACRIAESLVSRWIDFAVGGDDAAPMIRTSVRDPVKWVWPILEYVEEHDLTPRMVLADDVLARWITRDIEPEIVIEEVHTLAEGLLRRVTASGKRVRWPALLDRAEQQELVTPEDRRQLARLNTEFRNRLKHRTERIEEEQVVVVEDLIWSAIGALDHLMQNIRNA